MMIKIVTYVFCALAAYGLVAFGFYFLRGAVADFRAWRRQRHTSLLTLAELKAAPGRDFEAEARRMILDRRVMAEAARRCRR